jgi:hypothetical protein
MNYEGSDLERKECGGVDQLLHFFCFLEILSTLTFRWLPTSRILLRSALRDYGGQVAPAYANLLRTRVL